MDSTRKSVTRRAGIVGLGTLLSRILGLVRESVIAAFFPKELIDVYQVAFMIPNSFRRLTAEGSFSISVVSVFSKIWAEGDREASRRFVSAVFGFLLTFLVVLTIFGVLAAGGLTWLAGHGFASYPEKFHLAVSLTRTMFPYVLLISLTALAMGLLNSAGRFFAPAFAPVLLNLAIIGSAVGLFGVLPEYGVNTIYALAAGVLLGGFAQVALQIPSLRKTGLLVRPSWNLKHPGLKQVLKLTGPMVFGAAAYQVGLFISNSLASTLGHGAVTYIQFATRLMELPLAVLVMAISTAALPSLSALRGQGQLEEMKKTWDHSLRLALFVSTPAMIGLIVLAEPTIAVLYQRGLFTYDDTQQTAQAFQWMAVGICSIALLRQTVPVFYALETVRIPVIMTVLNIVVYVATAVPLKEVFGHVGLCMALSIAATAQAMGLVFALRKQQGRLGLGRILFSWIRMLLGSLLMGIPVWYVASLGRWELGGNSWQNIGVLALSILTGIGAYGGVMLVLRSPELKDLSGVFRKKIKQV